MKAIEIHTVPFRCDGTPVGIDEDVEPDEVAGWCNVLLVEIHGHKRKLLLNPDAIVDGEER